ncbi:MAG: response regulator [Alphaproteobacteria bacterium]|uniref:Response regulator n=1 Tax=Candidatus Nitrobium versatile TaxID=2884831 RepID=A0A953JEH3_9BACT|nr:response regulator [Candidatus Nitrobium versatile]
MILSLCDWEVPDITGDEVLHWVRRHPNLSATPFIMVTSRNDRPSVLRAIESGANAYVVKPYTAELLAQKITAVIDKFDRRQYERYTATGAITVHFHELVARGKLIDMSRGGLFSSFSRKNPLPSIFERVLIDIKLEDVQKTRGGDQPPSQLTEKTESLLLTFKKPGRTTPPSPPVPGMA